MDSDVKFAPLVPQIFKEIEPSLLALAHRYRAPNPSDTVKGWLSRAYEIVARFDQGELKKKVYLSDDSQEDLVCFDPSLHEQHKFIKSLKNYLKHCFTNDIIKIYNSNKRKLSKQDEIGTFATSQYSHSGFSSDVMLFKYDSISIDSIIRLISLDYDRVTKGSTSLIELTQSRFLLALLNHCKATVDKGGDWSRLVVVPDVDEADNKKFFSEDFRCDLEDGVRKQLAKIIVGEDNPFVVEKLGVLVSRENRGTLQKRLFRYFFTYRKGFPDRLRSRVQNKTL